MSNQAPAFKIGISMAGAVSAGAYTAGVLDFLAEALDAWYNAKARGEAVPSHDVSIEVMSGASAGGMCAAISSVMLQENFQHIDDPEKHSHPLPVGTVPNRLYESWVNKIDIHKLLQINDVKHAGSSDTHVSAAPVRVTVAHPLSFTDQFARHSLLTKWRRPWVSGRDRLLLRGPY